MRTKLSLVAALAVTVMFAAGCKKKSEESATPPAGSAAMTGSAGSAEEAGSAGSAAAEAKLTDPQIAAIVVAANQVDIDAGNLALKKTKNPEVKKLAERMVTDHTAVNKAAVDLVTKLGVTPEETDASKGLTADGASKRAELEKLDGDAFDKAYVDNEVAYHTAVIGVLDTQLIPSATNDELKKTLVGVKPAFDAHLEHAKQVQSALAGGGSAAGHDH